MRKERYSIGELNVDRITGAGMPPFSRRKIFLDATSGSDGNDGLAFDRAKKTLAAALAKINTDKRDSIYLIGKSSSGLSLSADPAWTYNGTDLIGLDSGCIYGGRSRIGMASDYGTPAITISGHNNRFSNIDFMHGFSSGHVAHVGVSITGTRNAFFGCHFNGPLNTDLATATEYVGVSIAGSENYFNHCIFGARTLGRTQPAPNVKMIAGVGDQYFEDCVFQVCLGDGDPTFLEIANTASTGLAVFKRCMFIAFNSNWATAMTVAFQINGDYTCGILLDPQCQFYNVTAHIDTAKDQFVWMPAAPVVGTAGVDNTALLATKLVI